QNGRARGLTNGNSAGLGGAVRDQRKRGGVGRIEGRLMRWKTKGDEPIELIEQHSVCGGGCGRFGGRACRRWYVQRVGAVEAVDGIERIMDCGVVHRIDTRVK